MFVHEDDDVEIVVRVRLQPEEFAWLKRLEQITGDHPTALIAAMLRDIRIDDEAAHGETDGAERQGRRH